MGEEGSNGAPSYGVLQLAVFLGTVFIVIGLMGAVIFSIAYVLYGGIPYIAYVGLSLLTGTFILSSLIASNRWHNKAMVPLYLASMLLLASYLYAFASSMMVSLAMLAGIIGGWTEEVMPVMRMAFALSIVVPMAYGLWEARSLRTRTIELTTAKRIGRELKVVLFSDLHLGMLVRLPRLERIVRIVGQERPDVVIIGGDLYDTSPDNVRWSEPALRQMAGAAPTFMVTGNHEFFHGVDACVSTLSNLGIKTLRGDGVLLKGAPLFISGLDDPSDMRPVRIAPPAIPPASKDPSVYSIFVYHRPQRSEEMAHIGYDLELCGHTHWGQLAPFNLATYLAWGKYYKGLHRIGGSFVYTSAGAGTWGPPIRAMAPPEVVIIKVRPGRDGRCRS